MNSYSGNIIAVLPNKENTNGEFHVINEQGRLIDRRVIKNESIFNIRISEPAGVYFLHFSDKENNKKYVVRIVNHLYLGFKSLKSLKSLK
jgi:hypothetical protein